MRSMEIRRTYKVRLYANKRNKHLQQQIDFAGIIWNHALALQRRTCRLTGHYINRFRLFTIIGKMRRTDRVAALAAGSSLAARQSKM